MLKQKVDNIQKDMSIILKMQKEILERQEDILKDINLLKKEEKLTQLEIEELNSEICEKYFDLKIFINDKYYKLKSVR